MNGQVSFQLQNLKCVSDKFIKNFQYAEQFPKSNIAPTGIND